ncbi:MAG: hypothetical protein GF335_03345 [Candidatus Moranbacteria bacterium]|nr:hypothetical protein [Candidatus Moranbacteria bacterium]
MLQKISLGLFLAAFIFLTGCDKKDASTQSQKQNEEFLASLPDYNENQFHKKIMEMQNDANQQSLKENGQQNQATANPQTSEKTNSQDKKNRDSQAKEADEQEEETSNKDKDNNDEDEEEEEEDEEEEQKWETYENKKYGYSFSYPQNARINQEKDSCTTVEFECGFIAISPDSEKARDCYKIEEKAKKEKEKTESINIEGDIYEAQGKMLYKDDNDSVDFEFLQIELNNGMFIKYGSCDLKKKDISYQQYLRKKRNLIGTLISFEK